MARRASGSVEKSRTAGNRRDAIHVFRLDCLETSRPILGIEMRATTRTVSMVRMPGPFHDPPEIETHLAAQRFNAVR
jgi:hypothetical protein